MAAVPVPVPPLDQGRFAYLKPKDVAGLAQAYRFSEAAHAGQKRQSGDPYISHPLAVAEILADWHLDGQTLMAALLHDVTEDTSVTKDEISDSFGKPVAELVDGSGRAAEPGAARDAVAAARDQAEYYRAVVLPLRARIVEETQLHYNAMQVSPFQLLTARQQQIDAGAAYVGALRTYARPH